MLSMNISTSAAPHRGSTPPLSAGQRHAQAHRRQLIIWPKTMTVLFSTPASAMSFHGHCPHESAHRLGENGIAPCSWAILRISHDDDCLAHAGAAEGADFTALAKELSSQLP
jgi:hypothetical protein